MRIIHPVGKIKDGASHSVILLLPSNHSDPVGNNEPRGGTKKVSIVNQFTYSYSLIFDALSLVFLRGKMVGTDAPS